MDVNNIADTLRIGSALRAMLLDCPAVKERITSIFPVISGDVRLPSIAYRRVSTQADTVKTGADSLSVLMEVNVYTATYPEGVDLAGAVCDALHNKTCSQDGRTIIRRCLLADAEELYSGDAYVQTLTFKVKL